MKVAVTGALLRRHEDDPIRSARTIDSTGSPILEDIEALDIVGVEVRQITTRHPVDDDEWAEACSTGGDPTHLDACLIVGVTCSGIRDTHTSDLPLDHHRGVDGSHLREVLGGDVGDSGGQLLLAHRAIADDDDLIERSGIFGEDDLDLTTAIKGYLKGLVSDVAHADRSLRILSLEDEVPLGIGHGTIGRTLLEDGRPDDGLTCWVSHGTLDAHALGKEADRGEYQGR